MGLRAIGDSGLKLINGRVYEELRNDLIFPNSISTFKRMLYDSSISTAKDLFDMMIRSVDMKAEAKDESNENAVRNAEFINWMFDNLENQTFQQFLTEVLTYNWAGFSILEKVFEEVKEGEYEGLMRIKEFSPRSQDSLDRWLWKKSDPRQLAGIRQNIRTSHLFQNDFYTESTKDIPLPKLLLFSYNSTKGNPEGRSPLIKCYVTWKFKCLIEDYEATGIAKDMSGVPVIGIPKDIILKGTADPSSPEGVMLGFIKAQAASMQAGEELYAITPIEYTETGKPLYELKLQGVQGGSKNYDSNVVIQRRQNEILMAYFADVLKLGNDGSGSFALADSKTNILGYAIADHIQFIVSNIQKQVIEQLARMNGWKEDEIPVFKASDVEDLDLDEFSKSIQRIFAVGGVEKRRDEMNLIREKAFGLPPVEGDPDEIIFTENDSRVGDGMSEGMPNGTGNSSSGGDDSVGNNENASAEPFGIPLLSDEEIEEFRSKNKDKRVETARQDYPDLSLKEIKEILGVD